MIDNERGTNNGDRDPCSVQGIPKQGGPLSYLSITAAQPRHHIPVTSAPTHVNTDYNKWVGALIIIDCIHILKLHNQATPDRTDRNRGHGFTTPGINERGGAAVNALRFTEKATARRTWSAG